MIAETIYLPLYAVTIAVYGALVLFWLVLLALIGPQAVRDLCAWSRETLPSVDDETPRSVPVVQMLGRAVYEACVEHCQMTPTPWDELSAGTRWIYAEYARCLLCDLSPDTCDCAEPDEPGQRRKELDAVVSLTERRGLRLM